MSSPEDDAICPVHGWMSHVFLHEAAHAVAAIDRDIEFRHVTITTPAGWTKDHPDGIALGGLYLDPPASRWVESQPLKAYEMVLAGSLAEREALAEREVLLGMAPHIAWPLRFVLPHHRTRSPRTVTRKVNSRCHRVGEELDSRGVSAHQSRGRSPRGRLQRHSTDPAGLREWPLVPLLCPGRRAGDLIALNA